ncbi:hypothetical protein HZC07_01975 [Candidatus Micrarchaeota archaeon]|nr:hypothetical protein [Candidatus Micrarchaeota archaeon]
MDSRKLDVESLVARTSVPSTVSTLAKKSGISKATIGKYLLVMEAAGRVKLKRLGAALILWPPENEDGRL